MLAVLLWSSVFYYTAESTSAARQWEGKKTAVHLEILP